MGDLAVDAPSNFYFKPSGLAHLVIEPKADWWPDYLSDTNIRIDNFIPDTELLKDPTIRHNGRLWHHYRIIVPRQDYWKSFPIITIYHQQDAEELIGRCACSSALQV